VSEFKGLYNFYTQLLVGDRADNIPGVSQIGKVKASRILEKCKTEDDLFDAVRYCYNNDDLMYLYGRLLWILRKEGDIWNPVQIGKLCLGETLLEVILNMRITAVSRCSRGIPYGFFGISFCIKATIRGSFVAVSVKSVTVPSN
jgi:hypothetical protein